MLAVIWIFIIGFSILMYVVLDGFTLGTGILLPFLRQQHDRDIMLSVILPTWDGNQTWLVLGAAALYGAFPLAFATLLPILYLPIITMVLALLFRGVAIEFRLKTQKWHKFWDIIFFVGSLLATFIQGDMLGTFVQGFDLTKHLSYAFLTPFAFTSGLGLVVGYALLGATRLIFKLTGELQDIMYHFARLALGLVAIFMAIISLWTPFINPVIFHFWFNLKRLPLLALLPITTTCLFFWCAYELYSKKHDFLPFPLCYAMFFCGYAGLGLSTWPYIVPRSITVWQAAAPDNTLMFMLVGACILLPVLLFYTGYAYKIFSGKVTDVIKY